MSHKVRFFANHIIQNTSIIMNAHQKKKRQMYLIPSLIHQEWHLLWPPAINKQRGFQVMTMIKYGDGHIWAIFYCLNGHVAILGQWYHAINASLFTWPKIPSLSLLISVWYCLVYDLGLSMLTLRCDLDPPPDHAPAYCLSSWLPITASLQLSF